MSKEARITDAIKSRMKELGMTRSELAEKMSVRPSVVTKWLNGNNNFTLLTILKIEQVLQTQIIYVVKNNL